MKPFANFDTEWLASELNLVEDFREEWDSTSVMLDFGASWAVVGLRFRERDGKVLLNSVCYKGRENLVNNFDIIKAFAKELDDLVYQDELGVTESVLSDVRGALKAHHFDARPTATAGFVATAILEQRHNKDTDRQEWALVSKKKDPKTGEHRVLYWFGARRPSDEAVKKQEQRIQYFKHKNG